MQSLYAAVIHVLAACLPMSDLFIEIEKIMSSKLVNVVYGAIGNCSALSKMLLRQNFVFVFVIIICAVQLYNYCLSIFDENKTTAVICISIHFETQRSLAYLLHPFARNIDE